MVKMRGSGCSSPSWLSPGPCLDNNCGWWLEGNDMTLVWGPVDYEEVFVLLFLLLLLLLPLPQPLLRLLLIVRVLSLPVMIEELWEELCFWDYQYITIKAVMEWRAPAINGDGHHNARYDDHWYFRGMFFIITVLLSPGPCLSWW